MNNSRMPFLIGLCGKAGAGKDTVGKLLQWPTYAFARTLKDMLAAAGLPEPADRADKERVLPNLGFSWRHAAQTLGTEWGRKHLGDDVWVKFAKHWCVNSGHGVVVFTDLRFENEAMFIRKHGLVVHVVGRATDTQLAGHVSEAGVEPLAYDMVILNDSDLDDLKQQVERFRSSIIGAAQCVQPA
jgi:hypothetical protein